MQNSMTTNSSLECFENESRAGGVERGDQFVNGHLDRFRMSPVYDSSGSSMWIIIQTISNVQLFVK